MNLVPGNWLIATIALIAWAMSLGAILFCVKLKGKIEKSPQRLQRRPVDLAETDGKLRELEVTLRSFDARLKDVESNVRNVIPGLAGPYVSGSLITKSNTMDARALARIPAKEVNGTSERSEREQPTNQKPNQGPEDVHAVTETDSGDGSEVAETESYSLNLVEQLYSAWCKTHVPPRSSKVVEVVMAAYLSSENAGGVSGGSVHTISDTSSVAEFVRFSATGSAVGLVLPNPDATFTPVVAHLFPGLTRESHSDRAALTMVRPVSVQQRRGPVWEVV